MKRRFKNNFWRGILCHFKWYRSWYGGVWEHWIVDTATLHGTWWFDLDKTTEENQGIRPSMVCKGTPIVEDYRGL